MTNSIQKTQQPCSASFPCFYRKNDSCSYGQQVEAILSELQEKYHKGFDSIIQLADIFSLPCIDLDKDARQRVIGNILELSE